MALWRVPAWLRRLWAPSLLAATRLALASRWAALTQDAAEVTAAAERYQAAGRPFRPISLRRLERWAWLAPDQLAFVSRVPAWQETEWDVALGPWHPDGFAVAIATAPGQRAQLPSALAAQAARVYFPYPRVYHGGLATGTALLVFGRPGAGGNRGLG